MTEYDVTTKMTYYEQITPTSCAATCAAMCVNRKPEKLQADGFNLDNADWAGIAKKYGYKTTTGSSGLSGVLEILEKGYPVIARVNTGSKVHWVVVVSFEGDAKNPVASNFDCADPWTGLNCALNEAVNYSSVSATRYYY